MAAAAWAPTLSSISWRASAAVKGRRRTVFSKNASAGGVATDPSWSLFTLTTHDKSIAHTSSRSFPNLLAKDRAALERAASQRRWALERYPATEVGDGRPTS